jgi:hypothetical protein
MINMDQIFIVKIHVMDDYGYQNDFPLCAVSNETDAKVEVELVKSIVAARNHRGNIKYEGKSYYIPIYSSCDVYYCPVKFKS